MSRSKYGNRHVQYDGYTFDSLMERRRYQELKLLEAAGEIYDLKVHPPYQIFDAYKQPETGKRIRAVKYIADFEYKDSATAEIITEDVKGVETAVFKLKRKLFEVKYERLLRLVQTYENWP